MEEVIHYNEKTDRLWFPWDQGGDPPYPCQRGSAQGRRIAVFSARYPFSLAGARVFKKFYPRGKATREALQVISTARETERQISECAIVSRYEKGFRAAPYQHQREAIEALLHFERLALLLEQGLGKTYITLMALEILRKLGLPHRALIICPNIVFQSWLGEARKYTDLRFLPYKGNPDARKLQRADLLAHPWDCCLTTFDMLLDKPKTGLSVYRGLWEEMTPEDRSGYADLWLAEGQIDADRHDYLVRSGKTKSWFDGCARILRDISPCWLPLQKYLERLKEESNTAFLQNLPFDNLIVDEASRCLDHESRRSRIVESLSRKAKRTCLLSGTLCVGRPTDMFMPMNILDKNILGMNWTRFVGAYCKTARSNRHIITGYKNLSSLKLRIDPHVVARTRAECIDLPQRIFTRRYYELSDEMRRLYNNIAEKDSLELGGATLVTTSTLIKLAKCLQVLNGFVYYNDDALLCNDCPHLAGCVADGISQGGRGCRIAGAQKPERKTWRLKTNPKLDLLLEDLRDSELEKTIVWAWHVEDLQAIKNLLVREKIAFVQAGDTDSASRFEQSSDIRVFLGQTAQGIGITLNTATCTIYYSHGAALEPRLQSMDRNYRIGQTKPVIVKDYLARGTVEESLVSLLAHKADVKSFMQERVQCLDCWQVDYCQENSVQYLGRKCLYHGQRLSAEKIKRLKLRPAPEKM